MLRRVELIVKVQAYIEDDRADIKDVDIRDIQNTQIADENGKVIGYVTEWWTEQAHEVVEFTVREYD